MDGIVVTFRIRISCKFSRIRVDDVNLTGNVSRLRDRISTVIDVPSSDIEFIYCGRCLQDQESVESYGISSGVTVHVMKKVHHTKTVESEQMDKQAVQQMTTALQAAFLNPATNRNVAVINRMLTAPETLENIIAATPGLESDPIALAILQTPQFFAYLADPETVQKILGAHPCLGPAAMMVAVAINEEAAKGGLNSSQEDTPLNPGVYSLDQMSDDEDFDGTPTLQQHNQYSGPAITNTQLSAALAAATQGTPPQQLQSRDNQSSTGISGDFFRQAMMQAMGGSPTSSAVSTIGGTSSSQLQQQQLQSQIQQLREMGITDDAAALQALQASGGDLQMALSILFGDSM